MVEYTVSVVGKGARTLSLKVNWQSVELTHKSALHAPSSINAEGGILMHASTRTVWYRLGQYGTLCEFSTVKRGKKNPQLALSQITAFPSIVF